MTGQMKKLYLISIFSSFVVFANSTERNLDKEKWQKILGLETKKFGRIIDTQKGNSCELCQCEQRPQHSQFSKECCVCKKCDATQLCDSNYSCVYHSPKSQFGVCKIEKNDKKCQVNDSTVENGETFFVDCRTQCVCKNGTSACISLCPSEDIVPGARCKNARLIEIEGQCCKEWSCELHHPVTCDKRVGPWSSCSAKSCGLGTSGRWVEEEPTCQRLNETRFCQNKPCDFKQNTFHYKSTSHHIRRNHRCRATVRSQHTHLKVGACLSLKKYTPRFCNLCPLRRCTISHATTISVTFLCPLHDIPSIFLRYDPQESYGDFLDSEDYIYQDLGEGEKRILELYQYISPKNFKLSNLNSRNFNAIRNQFKHLQRKPHEKFERKVEFIQRCNCTLNF